MTGFLRAHGYDPGPTQRPRLAGAIVGTLATIPATAALLLFGSLQVGARIVGLSVPLAFLAGVAAMAVAGTGYGALFQRSANDRRGGWLFGTAFGFLLWMGGAVMILPALGGGRAPAGTAAIGIFLALLAWGAAAGFLFPIVHRRLHRKADRMMESDRPSFGPSAAAGERQQLRR